MIHPVVVNPVLGPLVGVKDPVRWLAGKLAPEGAIMYFDASKNKPLLPVTYNGKYLVVRVTDPVRWSAGKLAPEGAIMYFDASKNKPLLPVTYNGKYLVVKNV